MRPLLLALLASTCAPPLALEGAPCPCVTGWTCCESASVCVRDGASCPIVPGPAVSTTSIELGQDRLHHFTSPSPDVSWSIDEGDAGGTIDQSGRYRAPWTVGTYHLTARAGGGATRITVTVRPLKLATLAGSSGGPSRIPVDGVEQLARLSRPRELARLGGALYFFDDDNLRRVTLATKEVVTVIRRGERTLTGGVGEYHAYAGLSSTGTSLLFREQNCVREYFPDRDALDTFWCAQLVFAVAGDGARLVRFGGQPRRLVVVDRSTRQEVELPAPPNGWSEVLSLSLFASTLWVLDKGGDSLVAFDLDQPAQPGTIIPAPPSERFIDLDAVHDSEFEPRAYVLSSTGSVRGFNRLGRQVDGPLSLGRALAFANDDSPFDFFYVLTSDSIRHAVFPVDELLAGKPARDLVEVDGVGGEARLVVFQQPKVAIRGDVTWIASALRIRRIARDGTTTSVSTNGVYIDDFTANDRHLYVFNLSDQLMRRAPIGGGAWETLTFKPSGLRFAFVGALADGRIAFIEDDTLVGFVDPSTGEVPAARIPLPLLGNLGIDPAGGLFGELRGPSSTRFVESELSGVQRFDFGTGRLTRVGPSALTITKNGIVSLATSLAAATIERQYAVSSTGEEVFVNDGMTTWRSLVGKAGAPVVGTGPLPGRVNSIGAIRTFENGDVLLFDNAEHVVLVVE